MATTDLVSLLSEGIKEHRGLEYKELDRVSDRIFKRDTTKSRFIDKKNMELYGRPTRRRPGEGHRQGAIQESFGKRFVMIGRGLADAIPIEDWNDDRYGVYHRMLPGKGGALARAFNVDEELVCAEFFMNLGYVSGTSVAGSFDGVAQFSTAHPISLSNSGTTVANRPAAEVDISIAAADAARTNMVTQLAANNVERLQNSIKYHVCNPATARIARQVWNTEWERGTADRNTNIMKRYNVEVLEWAYFTKSGATGTNNAWFVIGESHGLEKWIREECDIMMDTDINTKSYVFVADYRMDVGSVDFRGTYGSTGA